MRLAKFAAENALFESARTRFRAAYALAATAKDEAKQTEVMTVAADYVEKFFRASVAKRDFTNAKKMLSILVVRLAETRTEAQRAELVKLLDDAQEKAREERKAAEDARAEKNRDDERVRLLKPIEAKIKEGNQDNSDGLVAKNGGTARQQYDAAIQCYIEAYKALTGLQKSKADDKILQERISTIIPDLYSDGIETCMNAASLTHDEDQLQRRARVRQQSAQGGSQE